jgi:RecA-family ATPase
MSLVSPIPFSHLLQTQWPEDIFIEGGLLCRGDTLLVAAESKAGKSTLLSSLVRELIIGGNFLGFKVKHPLSVLYLQAELREARLKERFLPTYAVLSSEALEKSFIWNTRGIILFGRDTDLIRKWIGELKPDVLLIDPFVNFHPYDENNATEMTKLTRLLDQIKSDFSLALILSHHFRKSLSQKSTDSLLERIRGSSSLRGWVDTTIAMEGRRGRSEYRCLEFETRNIDEPIRRLIKYNVKTKEFDWHDPVNEVYAVLREKMDTEPIPTAQVIQLILKECGHLVSRNRTKAFEIKDILVNTNQLLPSEGERNTILLSIAP